MYLQKPQTLNDLVSNTVTMIGSLWKRLVIIAALLFLPIAVAYMIGFHWFADALKDIVQAANLVSVADKSNAMMKYFGKLLAPYGLMLFAMLVYYVGNGFMTLLGARSVYAKIREREIGGNGLLDESRRLIPKWFGQFFVLSAVSSAVVMVFYFIILAFIGLIIFFKATLGVWAIVLGILGSGIFTLAFIAFIVWFSVSATFAPYSLAWEEAPGVFSSIGKSFKIVKKQFWRVFGITLLFGIVIGFAINIIISPLIFICIFPGYLELMKVLLHGDGSYMKVLPQFLSSFVWGIGLSFYLQSIIQSIVNPIFMALFFVDGDMRSKEQMAQVQSTTSESL